MKNYFIAGVIMWTVLHVSSAGKILYISLTASPSHNIWDRTLALALADKGHQVTYVTNSYEKPKANFSVITFEGVYEKMHAAFNIESLVEDGYFTLTNKLFDWVAVTCMFSLESNGLKTLLKQAEDNIKYDLIIFDITSTQCLFPIIEKFGSPPSIGTSGYGLATFLIDAFGADLQTSYIPNYGLHYTDTMSFFQRFANLITVLYIQSAKYLKHYPLQMEYAEKIFGHDIKHISVYESNFSIFLTNYDPVLTYPQPLPPAIIPVGGLHTKRANELPQDLKTYLDHSKTGVIVFSMGTNIRSDKLGKDKQKILLDAFALLNQNVIWKFESDVRNLPKNVIVRSFLPQNDLLAHPNVKLLINHGGSLSTQEGLYHGIPIIAIPFYLDQRSIVHRLVSQKLGLELDFSTLSIDKVLSTINEVLNNPIYQKNAQLVSRRYRDRPENPLDRAIFWVEHVMREGGTEYLRVAARNMTYFQLLHIDIFIFIALFSFLFIFLIYKSMGNVFKKPENKLKKN